MLKPFYNRDIFEAGCDEAGRGCLAGPVFAAAVILPENYKNELLNDSKIISQTNRNLLRKEIEQNATAWSVASVDNEEIDEINILNASILAMHKAIDKLSIRPEYIIVDGNRFKPYKTLPYKCFVKGDGKFASIAAASILAKTHRDEFMTKIHHYHPDYHWDSNKGYPTKKHKQAIADFGITDYHRKSFKLSEQLKIKFGV